MLEQQEGNKRFELRVMKTLKCFCSATMLTSKIMQETI